MQLHHAAPFPPVFQAPNPPGMTPAQAQVGAPRDTTLRTGTVGVGASGGAGSPAAPKVRHAALEYLEDAVLLLLVVFAVPGVIMLLALPVMLIFRVAAEIGQRW